MELIKVYNCGRVFEMVTTVDLEIFVSKIFRGNIFRVKKFSWVKGTDENFFTSRIVFCTNTVMVSAVVEVYRKACCVRGYHVYHGICTGRSYW